MKKTTLSTIYSALLDSGYESTDPIMEEIANELNKGQAKAEANRAIYAELHDAVILVLKGANNPVTAQEIADEIGEPRGKIVYGLTHYWVDEVVKDTTGKTTTYAIKA